jgi:hypothetical protein
MGEIIDKVKGKVKDVKDAIVDTSKDITDREKVAIGSPIQMSSSSTDRRYEEGVVGTNIERKSDPLKEYSVKEPMTPAKLDIGEPTAVKRDPSDQKITSEGQTGTNTPKAQEEYRMRGMTKVDTESITKDIIPAKNNDYNDKSINQNYNNNQIATTAAAVIENFNEKESSPVIHTTEESKKTIERNMMNESRKQIRSYDQTIIDTQERTSQTTRDITEISLEFQKQAINSFQAVFMPYFQNIQNQPWNNQDYLKIISEMYYKLISNFTESAIFFSRIFNEVVSSNMNFLTNVMKSSLVSQSRTSGIKVDSGRNSDESSTNVRATFSCETCGQTFGSRQDLKEHTSITHYK